MYTHVVDDYTGREMSMSNIEDKTFYPTFLIEVHFEMRSWGRPLVMKKVKDGSGQTGSDMYPFGLFWKTHATIVFPSA
jgi:hypothetical protein